jgi:hypothetical protein
MDALAPTGTLQALSPPSVMVRDEWPLRGGASGVTQMTERTDCLLGESTHCGESPSTPLPPRSCDANPGRRDPSQAVSSRRTEHTILVPRSDASYAHQHGDSALKPALCHAPDPLLTTGAKRPMADSMPVRLVHEAGGILWKRAPLAGVGDPPVADLPPLAVDGMPPLVLQEILSSIVAW